MIENCVNDNLTKQDLYDLLSAAAEESFFIFDNSHYRQTDGVVMGFPLGPTLANSFLCHHGKEWIDS